MHEFYLNNYQIIIRAFVAINNFLNKLSFPSILIVDTVDKKFLNFEVNFRNKWRI